MILREGLSMAIIGIAMGLPLVWAGAKFLEQQLTNMKAMDPSSLALTLGVLLIAALIATGLPALRAAGLDPAETLRGD
jgi:ABC-type antimicrobial peptide transport system permease subunit